MRSTTASASASTSVSSTRRRFRAPDGTPVVEAALRQYLTRWTIDPTRPNSRWRACANLSANIRASTSVERGVRIDTDTSRARADPVRAIRFSARSVASTTRRKRCRCFTPAPTAAVSEGVFVREVERERGRRRLPARDNLRRAPQRESPRSLRCAANRSRTDRPRAPRPSRAARLSRLMETASDYTRRSARRSCRFSGRSVAS